MMKARRVSIILEDHSRIGRLLSTDEHRIKSFSPDYKGRISSQVRGTRHSFGWSISVLG